MTSRVGLKRRWVVLAFLAMTALSLAVVNVGAALGQNSPVPNLVEWLQPWVRYDSGWYYAIATEGYFYREGVQSPVAFFPTYPLLMRAGGAMLGIYLTGILITVLAGLSAVLLFTRWCVGRLTRRATGWALALLLVYPYSLYLYGSVYADALFLACALGAFVLLERGHPWLAGLVGALAAAGRPVGVAVVLGLAVRAVELAWQRSPAPRPLTSPWSSEPSPPAAGVEHGRRDRVAEMRAGLRTTQVALRQVRWRDAGVLLAGAGLATYMAYQWWAFGNPLAFVATESSPGWDQGSGPKVWLKFAFFGTLLHGGAPEVLRLLLPALLLLGTIALLPRIRRQLGWGYAVYTAVVIAIPIVGTKDFMGCGRYLLVAFPAFAAAGQLLSGNLPTRFRAMVLIVSAAFLILALVGYGLGYEVS